MRGRRFLHPKLGFTFMAPEGFTLDNTAQAVLGVKDGGGQALRLDVVRVPAEQTLAEYLEFRLDRERRRRARCEDLTVNGFPAATAVAKGDQWEFRLYAIRFGSDVYRFIFATKSRLTEADRAFRESIESFRRLSIAGDRAPPSRCACKVVTVRAGRHDRTAGEPHGGRPIGRSSASSCVNGLEAGEALRPGDKVKIVVE